MDRRTRMQEALWGLFAADALAMPVHWYYNRDNIKNAFSGGVSGFEAPRHPHPESFMVGMTYSPDVQAAQVHGRPYDILHEHARFYRTTYSDLAIARNEQEGEHGNAVPSSNERYHYHHGLKAGDNTLNAHLARVLMRSVIGKGSYDPEAFLDGFVAHMTMPGQNHDPYTEVFIRRWFEHFSHGRPLHACAQLQRDTWSIGSHGGVHRALMIAMLARSPYQGLGLAIEHQVLTHRSENVASALGVLTPALHALLDGDDFGAVVRRVAGQIQAPVILGEGLFQRYRDASGPGNIPDLDMWRLHTELEDKPFDVDALLLRDESEVIRKLISTACYTEHGLPLMLYLALFADGDSETALLLNANAGGDSANRGLTFGMLVGAALGVPDHLKRRLADHDDLRSEIEGFVEIALGAHPF